VKQDSSEGRSGGKLPEGRDSRLRSWLRSFRGRVGAATCWADERQGRANGTTCSADGRRPAKERPAKEAEERLPECMAAHYRRESATAEESPPLEVDHE